MAINAERKPLSLYWEIRAFFYVGVLSLIWGVGAVVRTYASNIGIAALITVLTLSFLASLIFCFMKTAPFSKELVPSPTIAFDYVLYLGCALFSIDLGLLETNYHLLKNQWDIYLLGSSLLFLFLAYRFDNRLVLSLALTSLAGWFGLKLNQFNFNQTQITLWAGLTYGWLTTTTGLILFKKNFKKHFLDVYLNLGLTILFVTLIAGSFVSEMKEIYFLGLMGLCAITAALAVNKRRFLYLIYAIIYGYIGVSIKLIPQLHGSEAIFLYLIVSSLGVVGLIFFLSRTFKDKA